MKMKGLKIIYEPKGRAREYSSLAVNLYRGCSHGCKYCYAPSCLQMDRLTFYSMPQPRTDIIKQLKADCEKIAGCKDRVLLCFTCDPYQPIEKDLQITRQALEFFREFSIPFQVLTKGGMRAARDFDLYTKADAFATTLTLRDGENSFLFEPGAAIPSDRMAAIQVAHERGIETWVSFEPILDSEAVFRLLEATHKYVDLYKVGKVSHFKPPKPIDWDWFAREIVARLEALGKRYYIKEDLRKHL